MLIAACLVRATAREAVDRCVIFASGLVGTAASEAVGCIDRLVRLADAADSASAHRRWCHDCDGHCYVLRRGASSGEIDALTDVAAAAANDPPPDRPPSRSADAARLRHHAKNCRAHHEHVESQNWRGASLTPATPVAPPHRTPSRRTRSRARPVDRHVPREPVAQELGLAVGVRLEAVAGAAAGNVRRLDGVAGPRQRPRLARRRHDHHRPINGHRLGRCAARGHARTEQRDRRSGRQ